MLSAPLNLGVVDASKIYNFLYSFFHRDFVQQRTLLNGTIYINPRSHMLDDGKERDFWHLTSREIKFQVKEGNRYVIKKDRLIDYARSERIEWVRQIITNSGHLGIKLFYFQESNSDRDIRLYLWAFRDDFVVILQKLGRSTSFLVTSFYIDHDAKRKDYEKRYQYYTSGNMNGCEWF